MKGLEQFEKLDKTPSEFETISLYNGEVNLYYDHKLHLYWTEQDGVKYGVTSATKATGMLDKSDALTQWAANCAINVVRERWEPGKPYTEEDIEQILKKARFGFREIQRDALDIGNIAHDAIEQYLKQLRDTGQAVEPDTHENEKADRCIKAGMSWIKKHNIQPLELEKKVYSREHKYSGTVDCVCYMTACDDKDCCDFTGTKRALVDYKSSKMIYEVYYMQVSAYKQAWEEEFPNLPIDIRVILRLDKEGNDEQPFESKVLSVSTHELDLDGFLCGLGLFNWKKQSTLNGKYERAAEKLLRDALKPKITKRKVNKITLKEPPTNDEMVVKIEKLK